MDKKEFSALNPEVQAFLTRLDVGDVRLLEKSIDIARHIGTTAKVVRWLVITIAGAIIAVAGLWDAVVKLMAYFKAP